MLRHLLAVAILTPLAFSQTFPAFQWIEEIDSSAGDSFTGLGVDSAGNTYIAGSTYSPNFPVQSAAQSHIDSAGLYEITGPGSAYAALGLSSASAVVIDPQNPNTLYAIATSASEGWPSQLMRSTNGGATFTPLSLPSTQIETLTINPSNDQILYVGTYDQGLLKSTDGGATWNPLSSLQAPQPGQFEFVGVWIDPANPEVLLANAYGNLVRSADGGATWQMILSTDIFSVSFDSAVPGLVYASSNLGAVSVSTDDGQSFTSLTTPAPLGTVLPDPTQSGRLLGVGEFAIYVSTDSGSTWTLGVNLTFPVNYIQSAIDWAHGFLYVASSSAILEVSTNLQSMTPVGPPSTGYVASLAAANGVVYEAVSGTRDVYVTKLDPLGNIVYSTYFGGSNDDVAIAMTVDASGNVYVTGTTMSTDFPVTKGAYATSGATFVFKLNPTGSVAYSTYGPAGGTPAAIAVDTSGSAYIAGTSNGGLTTTTGVYEPTCTVCGITSNGFFGVLTFSGFASKIGPTGSTLLYSTYVGQPIGLEGNLITSVAVASDGTAYLGGANGIFHLNAAASAALNTNVPASFTPQSIAIAADGTVYAAGTANTFPVTAGAFEASYAAAPSLPNQGSNLPATVIARWDSQLSNVLDATYFGPGRSVNAISFDSAGNVYLGGGTGEAGLPTRTPIQLGFAAETGFVSELSSDLSTLLFSSYFGDTQDFGVQGMAVRVDGNVVLGGSSGIPGTSNPGPSNIWVNSVIVTPPPPLRIDSVVNAASQLDGPISAGETIVVQGAGFGSTAQLSMGGVAVPPISMTATAITATVPQGVPAGSALVQVSSSGASSNEVLVALNATAPGIFSQNGSGFGQGYILNKDGTLNTPSNPAAPGDPISVFATGVGPIAITDGYAVSQYPVDVYVDGIFCDGIEAFLGPAPGLPGNVFQIQVYVPNPANLVSANPNFQNFVYPPLVGLTMQVNGVPSQNGIAISIAQQ